MILPVFLFTAWMFSSGVSEKNETSPVDVAYKVWPCAFPLWKRKRVPEFLLGRQHGGTSLGFGQQLVHDLRLGNWGTLSFEVLPPREVAGQHHRFRALQWQKGTSMAQ